MMMVIVLLLLNVILLSYAHEKAICSKCQIYRYAMKSSASWPWYLTINDLSSVTEYQTFILQTIYTEVHVTEYLHIAEIDHTKYIILLKSRPETTKSKLETRVKACPAPAPAPVPKVSQRF